MYPPREDWDGNPWVGPPFPGYDGYGWSDERGLAWAQGLRISLHGRPVRLTGADCSGEISKALALVLCKG